MRNILTLFLAASALIPALALAQGDPPQPVGCGRDADCKGDRICDMGRCIEQHNATFRTKEGQPASSTAAPTAAPDAAVPAANGRVGAVMFVSPGLGPNSRNTNTGAANNGVAMSFMLELAVPLGGSGLAYEARGGYTYIPSVQSATNPNLNGSRVNGMRLEPLGFAYRVGLFDSSNVHVSIVPAVSFATIEMIVDNSQALWFLGVGADARFLFQLGHAYFSFAPVGIDFRFLRWSPDVQGNFAGHAGVNWRANIAAGFAF